MFHWPVLVGVLAFALTGSVNEEPSIAMEEVINSIHGQGPVRVTSQLVLELSPPEDMGESHVSEPVSATIDWSSPGNGVFRLGDYDAFIHDDDVVITREGVQDAYVRLMDTNQAADSIRAAFQSCPFPMLAIAFPDGEQDGLVRFLMPDVIEPLTLTTRRDDRGRLSMLEWKGQDVMFELDIDPETGRPATGLLHRNAGKDLPAGARLISRWTWSYEDIPSEDSMTFERGNRFRVDRLASLKRAGNGDSAAPDLRLTSLNGTIIDLKALRGRVVVVDFWATWCRPCIKALPSLQKLAEETAEMPVVILGVDCFEQGTADEIRNKVESRVAELSLTFPILLDVNSDVASRWGVQGIPATFVIDPAGKIVARHQGAGADYLDQLREEVEQALSR